MAAISDPPGGIWAASPFEAPGPNLANHFTCDPVKIDVKIDRPQSHEETRKIEARRKVDNSKALRSYLQQLVR